MKYQLIFLFFCLQFCFRNLTSTNINYKKEIKTKNSIKINMVYQNIKIKIIIIPEVS